MKAAWLVVLVLTLAAGCASAPARGDAQPGRQANMLTRDEIRAASHTNLHDVVLALRPGWLQRRGTISFADPQAGRVIVYLDDVAAGGAEFLRQISVNNVHSVQFFDSVEAAARFGLRQSGGAAIVVRSLPDR